MKTENEKSQSTGLQLKANQRKEKRLKMMFSIKEHYGYTFSDLQMFDIFQELLKLNVDFKKKEKIIEKLQKGKIQ